MALSDIVTRIAEDARRESDQILLDAKEAADDLRAQAEAHAQAEHDWIVSQGRIEVESEARTKIAAVRLAQRDRALAAKQEPVGRVLGGAVQRLTSLPDDEYAALLAREVARVARGDEEITVGEEDHARLSAHLPPALAREGVTIEITGSTSAIATGVLLLGERMRVEISPRALVESKAQHLTAVASGILFRDSGAAERDGG